MLILLSIIVNNRFFLSNLYTTTQFWRRHNAKMLGLAWPCMRKSSGTDEEEGRRAVSELTQAMQVSPLHSHMLTKWHDALTQRNFIDKLWEELRECFDAGRRHFVRELLFSKIRQFYHASLRDETYLLCIPSYPEKICLHAISKSDWRIRRQWQASNRLDNAPPPVHHVRLRAGN